MKPTEETKEQFMARYQSTEHGLGSFDSQKMIAMRCSCEEGGGPWHWAAIYNDPESIERHKSHEECLASLRENDA